MGELGELGEATRVRVVVAAGGLGLHRWQDVALELGDSGGVSGWLLDVEQSQRGAATWFVAVAEELGVPSAKDDRT